MQLSNTFDYTGEPTVDEQIRLECLKLANDQAIGTEDVIEIAETYYEYVARRRSIRS